MQNKAIGTVMMGCVLMGLFSGCQPKTEILPPSLSDNKAPLTGKQLFEENCAGCHGISGHGSSGMLQGRNIHFDEAAWQQRQTDDHIKQVIRAGQGMMPAFETTFSPEELDKLVQYIRTLPDAS